MRERKRERERGYIYIYMYICVCVCVYVREREQVLLYTQVHLGISNFWGIMYLAWKEGDGWETKVIPTV